MNKNKKIIIGIVIAVLTIGFISVGILKNSGISVFGEGKAIEVQTVKIEKGDISSYISASGVIREIEKSDVYFDTPMKVTRLLVQKNQRVTKGQKLVELDMSSLNSELDKLKTNKNLQELSANSDVADAEVDRATISLQSAERAYNDSKELYESNKQLFSQKAITQAVLDASQKASIESESALKLARIALKTAKANRDLNQKTSEQNLKTIDISIQDLENKISDINAASKSPIDGVIADMSITEGAYTNSMQPAISIINPDRLQVKANVREFDIKQVAAGQKVIITGDAINKDTPYTGKVSSISPVATVNQTVNGQETVIEVLIDIDDSKGLKPGLSVNCDISTVNKSGVLTAPMEVFKEDKDGNKLVFAIDTKNNTMVETPVKLGISSDMNVEVTGGLKEGDIVVLDPQPAYKTGDRVKIMDSGNK